MTVIGGRYRDIIKQFFLPQLNDNNRGGFSFSREFYRIFQNETEQQKYGLCLFILK